MRLNFLLRSVAHLRSRIALSSCFFTSPHGIAMPKGLYFTAMVYPFFRRLIPKVTDRISTKLGHVFSYDCNLKNLVRTPRAFTPKGWGPKNAFWDRLWTFWTLTKYVSATEQDINNRKETWQSTWTPPNVLQIWWTLVQKRLRTVGEFLPSP